MSDRRSGGERVSRSGKVRGRSVRGIDEDFDPLPADWKEQAAALADTFLSSQEILGSERELLEQFVHLCLRFAHMEKSIQGEIVYDLSSHDLVLRGEHGPDLLADAEELAAQERRSLAIPDGPIEDLAELLDDRGIKTIQWPLPEGMRRSGAFLFDASTGPALLSLAPGDSVADRLILAHEYGHLLADVDPYENRFCQHHDDQAGSIRGAGQLYEARRLPPARVGGVAVSEMRADLFARALLMPPEHFRRSLALFEIDPRTDFELSRLADLAFYYGVETGAAIARMADLRLLSLDRVRAIGTERESLPQVQPCAPAPSDADAFAGSPTHHPARFVNLGIAMFLKRIVSLDQMAALLGIDRAAARRFLSFTEIPAEGIQAEGSDEAGRVGSPSAEEPPTSSRGIDERKDSSAENGERQTSAEPGKGRPSGNGGMD